MSSTIQALLLLVTLALATITGIAGAEPVTDDPPVEEQPPERPTVTVRLRDNRFRPARITIAAGTTVVWVNEEDDPELEHNVIARDYRWASSNFLPGERYARTFTAPGTYRYFCDLHGGMNGQVIVE